MAEVPERPSCTAHGDTQEAALANAKDAVQLWVRRGKAFGDPIMSRLEAHDVFVDSVNWL